MRIFLLFIAIAAGFAPFKKAVAQNTRLYYTAQEGGKPALYDTNAVYISTFPQFKADLQRICGISITYNTTALQWEATCTERPFVAADAGKILVVKNARSYLAYRKAPFTLNAVITAIEGGKAIIESIDAVGSRNSFAGIIKAVNAECGFVATDNFEIMQQAIDSCAARGKKLLRMNYRGTAYMVPQRSSRPMPSAMQRTLVVNNQLKPIGYDSSLTKMKWGLEDISRVDENLIPFYAAFTIQGCAFTVKKMTLLSPDRGSTNVDHQNIECITGNADNVATKTGQTIIVDSSGIISEDGTGFEGWGRSIYMNGSIMLSCRDTAIQSVTNSTITSQAEPAFFSHKPYNSNDVFWTLRPADTLNRMQRIRNAFIKGGARYTKKAYGVWIKAGNDTVTVHDPNFSWYDHTDYEYQDNFRHPIIFVARENYTLFTAGDVSTIFKIQILQVINDSTAIMDTPSWGAPLWTTTNATLYTWRNGGGGYAAFHSLYITGNVGADNNNILCVPLRASRNVQSTCVSPGGSNICGSCLASDIGFQYQYYDAATYWQAAELKTIEQGIGYGQLISTPYEYFPPAAQKVSICQ